MPLVASDISEEERESWCQWFTAPKVAFAFQEWSRIDEAELIIDPAAGEGALTPDHEGVVAVEIDPDLIEELRYWRPHVRQIICADFLELEVPQLRADLAILNPPYANGGEGLFIYRSLLWAHRACALIRTVALNGKDRFRDCWRYVQPIRISVLTHRPRFQGPGCSATKYNPMADYMAVECVLRPEPLPMSDYGKWADDVVFNWVDWRP